MKLASKIILGFLAPVLIMVALSAAVYIFLGPVRTESRVVATAYVPLIDESSDVERFITRGVAAIRAYSTSENSADLDEALEHWKKAAESLGRLETVARAEATISEEGPAKIKARLRELEDMAVKFRDLITGINQSRETSQKILNDYLATCDLLLGFLTTGLEKDVYQQPAPEKATVDRLGRLLTEVDQLQSLGRSCNARYWQGVATRDQKFLDEGREMVGEIQGHIAALEKIMTYPSDLEALATIKKLIIQYQAALQSVAERWQVKADLDAQRNALLQSILTEVGQTLDSGITQTQETMNRVEQAVSRVNLLLLAGVAAATALSLLLAFLIARGLARPLALIINELTENADSINHNVDALQASATSLAEGATKNAAALEQSSAALEELSSMTNRNADNSAEANQIMRGTQSEVEEAARAMGGVNRAMDEIASSGQEISKIIKTIDEIAFQTNLLALNAAVESARAGEAGAGFAVVADEVRNLAIRSAEAAKNTTALIEATIKNISAGSSLVREAGQTVEAVAANAAKVGQLLDEVATASKEQATGLDQINRAVTEMDQVTQGNATTAEESAGAATSLTDQAGGLAEVVEHLSRLVHGGGAARS